MMKHDSPCKYMLNIIQQKVGLYSPIVGLYSPMDSALECEASVLRSIHSSGELNGALHALTRWALWTGEMSYS